MDEKTKSFYKDLEEFKQLEHAYKLRKREAELNDLDKLLLHEDAISKWIEIDGNTIDGYWRKQSTIN